MKERTTLGKNLVRLRKEKGLSQKQLADLSGLTRITIALYETRKINPPLENLEALAIVLNVNVDDLIGNIKSDEKNIFSNLDPRTLKKFEKLLSLPHTEKHVVYTMIDSLYEKKVEKINS